MRGWMERLRRWRDREGEKLRGMTLPKRIGYVFTYYKGWMLGFLVLALFAGYAADVVIPVSYTHLTLPTTSRV